MNACCRHRIHLFTVLSSILQLEVTQKSLEWIVSALQRSEENIAKLPNIQEQIEEDGRVLLFILDT